MHVTYVFQRETKNYYLFAEQVPAGEEPLTVGTLYLRSDSFDGQPPATLDVTISASQEAQIAA